jgi:hypothetical protein
MAIPAANHQDFFKQLMKGGQKQSQSFEFCCVGKKEYQFQEVL